MNDEKTKNLDLAISQIEKQHGKGSIMRLGNRDVLVPVNVIPTGSISIDAAFGGVAKTWEMSSLTVQMLWRIVTGQVSAKNISGPISIAEFAGISAYLGVTAFLAFLAIISVSLGVLNLMPVPLLDGGQVVYQVVEAVKGQIEVLMDGGIRRGTDIVKGLCMGARAVLCGRAYAYGLAAAGEAGVNRAIEILRVDLERTLRLLGCASVAQLDRSYVNVPKSWEVGG